MFTASWKFKILLTVVIPALEKQTGSLTLVKIETLKYIPLQEEVLHYIECSVSFCNIILHIVIVLLIVY